MARRRESTVVELLVPPAVSWSVGTVGTVGTLLRPRTIAVLHGAPALAAA